MKNKISKISKVIAAFVVMIMLVFADTQSVKAAASTIQEGQDTLLPGYIAGVKYHIKTNKSGGYVYCLNLHKKSVPYTTQYLQGEMDAGIAYILQNGYPNKSFTGDKKKDYYITEGAVWWYLDDTAGTSNLSKAYRSTGSDKYGLRKHIKKLVSGAKEAKKKGYSTPSISAKISATKTTLDSASKYYVSMPVTVSAKNIDGKYDISVTSAPKGTVITNVNGKQQNKFNSNEKFLIKIPASKIDYGQTVKAKVKVTASSTITKAYKYAPKSNSVQPVAILQPYTKSVADTITVSATKPKLKDTEVSILKLDKDTNKAVSGAVLVVKNSNGKQVAKFTSTKNAHKIKKLPNGTYTVEEVKAPVGYKLSKTKEKFKLTNEIRTAEVKFYNKAEKSKVSILKLDKDTNASISGAVLVVKNSNGKQVAKFTSTRKAHVINDLPNGTYTVEEVKAPVGYKLSTTKEKFTLSNKNKTVEVKFYNKAQTSVVSIVKLDKDTNITVAGAVLVVKNSSGKQVAKFTSTTDSYTITGLPNGTYTVEEIKAPAGYILSTTKEKFTLSNNVKSVEVKLYNKAEKSIVSILKLDKDTNAAVAGAKLVVTNSDGEEVAKFTSTEKAYVINDLPNGTYTVEEIEAPAGYELSTEKETFTISNDVKTVEVKFYNKAQTSVVSILKLDKNTDNPVVGAILLIRDANGNEIKRITSSENGVSVTGLSNGTYTVEEVEAPAGYELSTEKEEFTISDDTKFVEVKFYNTPKDRMVTISKIDSTTGKAVAGAVIVVTNSDGEEVARFTSTDKPYVINNISDGTYTVEEVEAPEGYFLNEETQTFTIDSEHLSYQVTIKNVPKTCENGGKDDDECYVEVPNTSSSSLPFYLTGIAIVSAGGLYVYKNNKKAYK